MFYEVNATLIQYPVSMKLWYCDPENGYYLIEDYRINNRYIITDSLPSLDVDGSEFITDYFALNSYYYFRGDGKFLWYNNSEGAYTITSALGYKDTDEDEWWKADTLGTTGLIGDYSEQGTASGTKTVSLKELEGWEKTYADGVLGRVGVYTACGGASGTKTVGLRYFDDQNNGRYVQSTEKDDTGHWRYGEVFGSVFGYPWRYPVGVIHYDSTEGWIIGTPSAENEWWKGSEPNVSSPVTFTAQGAAEDDVTITFNRYIYNGYDFYYPGRTAPEPEKIKGFTPAVFI